MKQKLKKQEIGFAQIKNEVLQDRSLSWKAKGIFAYIYSKPENWDFAIDRISFDSQDGYDSTNTGIKELEEWGYLERIKLKTGRIEYQIRYKPTREKAYQGKSLPGKTQGISNKEIISNKEYINNKEFSKQSLQDIPRFIKLFEKVNPSYEKFYANKTQRSAVSRLLEKYGFEKAKGMVKYLPIINADKYAKGKSITPLQLEDNLALIVNHYKQSQGNKIIDLDK